jgi:similar to spore coat protein
MKGGNVLNSNGISIRETLDIHELLMFKVLIATKAITMNMLVKDEQLKDILQQDIISLKEHIRELKNLIKNSPLTNTTNT